ncbi:hypothetical protein ES705_20121 [subsurface metagenome]
MNFNATMFLVDLFKPKARITPCDLSDDLRFEYEERAGIMEYHGGLLRLEAERLALADVVKKK